MVKKKHSPFLGGAGGGFEVSWTKSIQFFFFFFLNFPNSKKITPSRPNYFYMRSPEVELWVFRWTFSPSLLLFLLLLLLSTTNFPGNSSQSSNSYLFLLLLLLFLERFCLENCPLLSRELSTDSRQSSDFYFSSVQSSPGPDIKLAYIWLTNKKPALGWI